MKKSLSGILTLLLALVVQVSFAQQQRTITGTVTDGQGMPLPGVNVFVPDTNRGTQTDFNGEYTIQAAQGETLTFSFLGFETAEIVVGAANTINVTLSEDASELEEVVVVGYSTTSKESFTGTASVVSGEKLDRKNVSDVSQALAGEVAGVRIINTSGQPGTAATVRIRGIGSLNGNRSPLYVVDGVPYSGSINAINPADIATTTVLKDAAATAIYGARGANGVVVITTKRGKEGEAQIEVTTKLGQNFSLLPRHETIQDPEEYLEVAWEAMYNRGANTAGVTDPAAFASENVFGPLGISPDYNFFNVPESEIFDPATGQVRPNLERRYTPEDWEEYAFQPAVRSETNLKISGGGERSTYYTSFGYLKDKGYSIGSDFERISTRLNVTHDVTDWLSGSMDMGYSLSESNNLGQSTDSGSIFWFTDNIPPVFPLFLRDENGDFIPDPYFGGNVYDFGDANGRGFGVGTNSIAGAHQDLQNTLRHEINTNIFFEANITEGLSFETRFGSQYYNSNYDSRGNPFYGGSATQGGSLFKQQTERLSYNFLQLLRYETSFGGHSVGAFVAHESNSFEQSYLWASKSNLVVPDTRELNQGVVNNPPGSYTIDYTLESYFGQVNYDFDDTYFLSGTVRRDGSSRFLEDKWGTFGSAGAAWVLSNEEFMQDQGLIQFLKLKASYGLLGDQAGVGYYPGYNTFNVDNLNDEPSLSLNTIGNRDLTWETSKQFQVGVEFTLGDFLEGSVDYYNKITDDLIFSSQRPISLGYASIQVNEGSLRNSGVEFNLVGHVVDTEDFFLDLSVNGEFVSNEMLEMNLEPGTGEPKLFEQSGSWGREVGRSIYDFYMREYAGVNPATGVAMWNQYYYDANNNGNADAGEGISSLTEYLNENPDRAGEIDRTVTEEYAEATQKYLGKSAFPDVRGAFNLSTGYAGFTLSAQFLYQLGGYAYDNIYAGLMHNRVVGGNNWHVDIHDAWEQPGDLTNVPRISSNLDPNTNSVSSRFVTKADYLTLNNVRLGYSVPTDIVDNFGMSNLSIFVSGDNLMLFSQREGFNPSVAETGSSSTYTYSPLSTVTAGLRLNF